MEDDRYTIERIEGGDIKNSLGQAVVYGYYDKVVFGDSEYLACNQVIEKKAAEFQSQYENLKEQVKEADGAKSDYREGEFPIMIPVKCRILSFGKIISVFYFRQNGLPEELMKQILKQ